MAAEVTNSSSFHINLPEQCTRPAQQSCHTFNRSSTTCFGSTLPYGSTSFELATDANNLNQVKEKLLLWSGLKAVPRCWDKIQPLLCSVYFPPCHDNNITLPDRSICLQTRSPCKIVEVEYGWPDFLNCQNNDVFADNCVQQQDLLSFNASDCESPLIATDNPASFYDEVDGCGLQCMNPLFNQQEHDDMHAFIAGWATTACICTFFAMLSFFIDWKNSSKYPARIIFYINLCFFLGGIGWLAQFFAGAREEIVCRKDGTMRLGEPVGTGESPSCVIIFVIVYYFLMAGITWFDILSYSWFLMFKALGTYKDPLIGKEKVFHVIAWSIPFILLLACLAVSQIDGDSMSGICFIGYKNYVYRLGFLLIPVGIVLLIGGFFLFRGLVALFSIRKGHPGLLSESAVSKITWTMIRIGIFTVLAFVFVFVTFAAHLYEYTNQSLWEKSFREYIKCEANVTILATLNGKPPKECSLENHPNLSVMKLNLIALFGTGIVMSTWVWTKASLMNWRRAWFKLIGRSDNEMKRIQHRSRIIAKAFANRNILRTKGKNKEENAAYEEDDDAIAGLEYSEHTMTHQDPVGMDFDLHSLSQEMSSTWIRNVPKMVERRGGILPEGKSSGKSAKGRKRHSLKLQDRDGKTEPGLWAVSQYIDGPNMKTKQNKPTRKTAPAKDPNDPFIGTSPYNYPLQTMPRRVTAARQSHHLYPHPSTRNSYFLQGNCRNLDPRMLPCHTACHQLGPCGQPCFQPSCVNPDDVIKPYYQTALRQPPACPPSAVGDNPNYIGNEPACNCASCNHYLGGNELIHHSPSNETGYVTDTASSSKSTN